MTNTYTRARLDHSLTEVLLEMSLLDAPRFHGHKITGSKLEFTNVFLEEASALGMELLLDEYGHAILQAHNATADKVDILSDALHVCLDALYASDSASDSKEFMEMEAVLRSFQDGLAAIKTTPLMSKAH